MTQSRPASTNNNYYLTPGIYNLRHLSTSRSSMLDVSEINVVETLLTMIVCINGISCSYVQKLVDMIKASEKPELMVKYGIVQDFAKSGSVRSMNNRLGSLVSKYTRSIEELCGVKRDPDMVYRIINAMDYTDDVLKEVVEAYSRYFESRTTRNLIVKPADPVVLAAFMKALIMCDISANIYEHIVSSKNFPYLKKEEKYRVLNMDRIFNQLVKMLFYLDFRDSKGNPLEFNVGSVMQSNESKSIFSDILYILYSTEYLSGMLEARNKCKPTFGDDQKKSLLESYEAETMPLSYYNEKYKNYKR